MNARELLESGNVIQANPLLRTLRNGRFIGLFMLVVVLGFTIFLYASDYIYYHGVFIIKNPFPSNAFAIMFAVLSPIIYMLQERYWKRIEQRRFAAVRGEHSFLATEQPWPSEATMLLSPVIVLRRSRDYYLLRAAMLLVLVLIIALFFTGVNTFDKSIALFPSNSLLVFVVTFLAFGLFSLGMLFALSLSSAGQQQLTVSDGGVTVHENHQVHVVKWQEARLFAMYNALGAEKNGAAFTYELSSAKDIVRWTWILRNTYWVGMEPVISLDEYNWQMQALLSFVVTRTGLPLYDLRKGGQGGGVKD